MFEIYKGGLLMEGNAASMMDIRDGADVDVKDMEGADTEGHDRK